MDDFAATMPPSYRTAFDAAEIAAHAAIVARRGDRPTRVEAWRELPGGVTAICVVADDHPGLFAQISEAIVAFAVDIVAAQAYCRRTAGGAVEAVDLLWLRRVGAGEAASLSGEDVEAIGAMVEAIVAGRAHVERGALPTAASSAATIVRFHEAESTGGPVAVTIETVDRPGLLLAVTKALFEAGLQIVGLYATSDHGRAVERFEIAELDGAPLRPARLLAVQSAILAAVDGGATLAAAGLT